MPGTAGLRTGAEPLREEPYIGILIIIAAGILFSISDGIAKYLARSLPAVEVAWLRYLTFFALTLVPVFRTGPGVLRTRRPVLQLVRGLGLVGSAFFFITGLGFLPIAEATAINFVSPAFITALSIPFLGEQVGIRRWAALVVGLIGVLIVVRPGSGAFQFAAIFPIVSAACWAAGIIATRKMAGADRTITTLFWSALIGTVILSSILPFDFRMLSAEQIGLGIMVGLVSTAGQGLIVMAYRRAAASLLAPFSYVQLISSTIVGMIVFHANPDEWTLIGGAVVIASGIYTAHRERVRARERVARAVEAKMAPGGSRSGEPITEGRTLDRVLHPINRVIQGTSASRPGDGGQVPTSCPASRTSSRSRPRVSGV